MGYAMLCSTSNEIILSRRTDSKDVIDNFYLKVGRRISSCLIQAITDLVTCILHGEDNTNLPTMCGKGPTEWV